MPAASLSSAVIAPVASACSDGGDHTRCIDFLKRWSRLGRISDRTNRSANINVSSCESPISESSCTSAAWAVSFVPFVWAASFVWAALFVWAASFVSFGWLFSFVLAASDTGLPASFNSASFLGSSGCASSRPIGAKRGCSQLVVFVRTRKTLLATKGPSERVGTVDKKPRVRCTSSEAAVSMKNLRFFSPIRGQGGRDLWRGVG